jgi:hypothetical protein
MKGIDVKAQKRMSVYRQRVRRYVKTRREWS